MARCPAGTTKPRPVSGPSEQQASRCQNTQRGFQAGATDQAGADRHDFLVYSIAGLVVATLLAGGLGWGVSGRVLRPRELAHTACLLGGSKL